MREEAGDEPYADSVVTDEQLWLDLGGRIRVHDNIECYVNVRNLWDSQVIAGRRPFGARPNPPRWIQVGVQGEL